MRKLSALAICGAIMTAGPAMAASVTVTMHEVNAQGTGNIMSSVEGRASGLTGSFKTLQGSGLDSMSCWA